MPITLEELLASRDNRRDLQLELIRNNPDRTLVVLTVNIPGSEKRTQDSIVVGNEGAEVLKRTFGVEDLIIRDLKTGFEAYMLVPEPADKVKALTIDIEESHPLGRLMDIDVFDSSGNPISRSSKGNKSRRCLICGDVARVCMRTFAHSQEELNQKIHFIVNEFLRRH